MQIADLLWRTGALPGVGGEITKPDSGLDRAASPALERARLHALLPTSGILLAPPEAEDKLDISPLAHASCVPVMPWTWNAPIAWKPFALPFCVATGMPTTALWRHVCCLD